MSIADRFGLVDEMQRVVRDAEDTLNRGLARFARSGEAPTTVTCRFTPSPTALAKVLPAGAGRYVVQVPQGIGFRLLAWLRLLLPYWGRGNADLDVSPFVGFDPETYKLPDELRPIFEDFADLDELKQAIGGMEFKQPLTDKLWTARIEPMLGLGGLYIVLHEIAHVALRHFIQAKLLEDKDLAKFGLNLDEAKQCIELDADRFAVLRTVEFAVGMTKSDPRGAWVLGDIALSCGFVWVALLGLYDHRRKLFESHGDGPHLPPTLRHWLMASIARAFLRDRHPHLESTWETNERTAWTQAVSATHLATLDYCGSTRKTIHPVARGIPYTTYKVWPLGGMVYGSLAEFPQGRDFAWQEFERLVNAWSERLGRFQEWQKATGEFAGGRASPVPGG